MEVFRILELNHCPLNLARLLIYGILLCVLLFITLIINNTYPHFSLVSILVSKYMIVNYQLH